MNPPCERSSWGGDHAKHGGGVIGFVREVLATDPRRSAPSTPPPPYGWSPSPSSMGRNLEPRLHGQADRVGGGLHAELFEQKRPVHLYRLLRQSEVPGDLLVALARG